MKYDELKAGITDHLNKAAEDFFIIGYFLRQINDGELYLTDGYKTIWEFAKGEYGLSTSSASRFMGINARFTIDDGQHMDEKYIGMGPSKLQEMLTLSDAELEKVTKEMTVKQIRDLKKPEPVSYYGLTKTVYEEGSTLSTPGCGHKHDCFTCAMPCELRQEDRYCVDAPLGNPYPCNRMAEEARKDMAAGMYKEACQFLNPELAEHRAGDNEPSPCCRNCEHKAVCYSCCEKVKQEVEAEKRKKAAEIKKEIEAKKPDPTKADYEPFYRWIDGDEKDLSTAALKKNYSHAGGGGAYDLKDYQGSSRGLSLNHKREVTWAAASKELRAIQEEKKSAFEKLQDRVGAYRDEQRKGVRTLDEAFKEAQEEKTKQEKRPDIDGCIREFYGDLYESTKQVIKNRDAKAITKQFKSECGETFEEGKHYGCTESAINLHTNEGTKVVTWGRFAKQLFQFLDRNPDIEKGVEPEIIDAEFKEIDEEPEKAEVLEPENDKNGKKNDEKAENLTLSEENDEDEGDLEAYELRHVAELLRTVKRDLEAGREAKAPATFMRNQRIRFDALSLLFEKLRKEAEDD